jgi:hypothetical protein
MHETTHQTAYKDERRERLNRASEAVYQWEHMLAYIAAAVAVGLAVIGLLVGFGVIDTTNDLEVTDTATGTAFTDGLLWLLPALSMAILAYGLHAGDHHRAQQHAGTELDRRPRSEVALWSAEHLFSMIAGGVALALAAVAILVGFDVFDRENVANDGFLWAIASIGAAILTAALHAVEHHQVETDEDYIVSIVEERVRGRSTETGSQYQPSAGTPEYRSGRQRS